jgi:hypothetical protein
MSDNSFIPIKFDNNESKEIFEIQDKTMCSRYKTINESGFVAHLNITNNEFAFFVKGNLEYSSMEKIFIKYSAANPPTYSSNFSGSGMPFPNEDIAFENTPNRGVVEIVNGHFNFTIKYPNSYYTNMGSIYIEPYVNILLVNSNNEPIGKVNKISLGNGIPFRSLTYPELRDENGVLFYNNSGLPVRTQYQILLDSAYPSVNKEPSNFWGLKPAM